MTMTETKPMLDPSTITDRAIEDWARANLDRAKVLGLRLIQNQTPEKLEALDSLGDDEDLIEAWAIKHPLRASILVMKLLPLFQAETT